MRARPKKSWTENLADDKDLPKVVRIEGRMIRRGGAGPCAIPAPRQVDALIRRVLEAGGKLNPKFPGGGSLQAERLRAEGPELWPGAASNRPG